MESTERKGKKGEYKCKFVALAFQPDKSLRAPAPGRGACTVDSGKWTNCREQPERALEGLKIV